MNYFGNQKKLTSINAYYKAEKESLHSCYVKNGSKIKKRNSGMKLVETGLCKRN